MQKKYTKFLIVFILCVCLCNYVYPFQYNAKAENPPLTSSPFVYVTTYAPENSFGASEFTEQLVNWSWIESHTTYLLTRDGVDVTSTLRVNFSMVFTARKYSYDFVAGSKGYFEFTLTFNSLANSSWIDDSCHTVFFNYSENEVLFYNFSDIWSIVGQFDSSFSLVDGVFSMVLGRSCNKNVHIVLDPIFGWSSGARTTSIQSGSYEYLWGSGFLLSLTGSAIVESITIKTANIWSVDQTLECSLYNWVSDSDVGTKIATTEQKNGLTTNTVYVFNFSTKPIINGNLNYFLLVRAVTDLASGACRLTSDDGGYQIYKYSSTPRTFDSPLTGEISNSGYQLYIYATYTINNTPVVSSITPVTGSGCISSPYNLSEYVSDYEGDYMTVNYTVQDFPNLTTSLYYEWNNCVNGTYGYDFALSQSTMYIWTSRVNDSITTVTNITYFATDCTCEGGGGTSSLTLYENIINATGTHEYQNLSGHYTVWANYTGNATGCNLTGLWYINYSNSSYGLNVTFNATVNKTTGAYLVNYSLGDNMEIAIESSQLSIFLTLVLFMFFFYVGYTQQKNTGGFLMFISGFIFLALDFLISPFLDNNLITPFLGFLGIFIIIIGLIKWLYWDEDEDKISFNRRGKKSKVGSR